MDEAIVWTLIDVPCASGNVVVAKLLLGPVGGDSFGRHMSVPADVPANGKADVD